MKKLVRSISGSKRLDQGADGSNGGNGNGSPEWRSYYDGTARFCLDCDHQCEDTCRHRDPWCVCDGEPKPPLRRCALERHLHRKQVAWARRLSRIPHDYVSMNRAALVLGVTKQTVRNRIKRGDIVGAFKLGDGQRAPWAVPKAELK